MDIEIDVFDPDQLSSNKKCLIIGDPKSGKSTLIKDILFSISDTFTNGNVCTNREHKQYYSTFFPVEKIYNRYSSLTSDRLFLNGNYLVLDDYSYHKTIYDEIIKKSDTTILLLISSLKFLNVVKYDYIFICKFTNIIEITRIYNEYYIIDTLTLSQFIDTINQCTDDYGVLVLDTTKTNPVRMYSF